MRSAAACLPRLSPPAASPAVHRGQQPFGQRPPGAAQVGLGRGLDHLRTGQHVAGDAEVVAHHDGRTSRRTMRRCAPRRRPAAEHVQLPLRLPGVGGGQGRDHRRPAHGPAPAASGPAGPYSGFISACVDSAPTPRRVCTHNAPTAKKRLAMATPKRPLSSRARIDQVKPSPRSCGVADERPASRRARGESVWSRAWRANEYTERCTHASCHGALR